jgi:hypothetical protein
MGSLRAASVLYGPEPPVPWPALAAGCRLSAGDPLSCPFVLESPSGTQRVRQLDGVTRAMTANVGDR